MRKVIGLIGGDEHEDFKNRPFAAYRAKHLKKENPEIPIFYFNPGDIPNSTNKNGKVITSITKGLAQNEKIPSLEEQIQKAEIAGKEDQKEKLRQELQQEKFQAYVQPFQEIYEQASQANQPLIEEEIPIFSTFGNHGMKAVGYQILGKQQHFFDVEKGAKQYGGIDFVGTGGSPEQPVPLLQAAGQEILPLMTDFHLGTDMDQLKGQAAKEYDPQRKEQLNNYISALEQEFQKERRRMGLGAVCFAHKGPMTLHDGVKGSMGASPIVKEYVKAGKPVICGHKHGPPQINGMTIDQILSKSKNGVVKLGQPILEICNGSPDYLLEAEFEGEGTTAKITAVTVHKIKSPQQYTA